MRRLIFLMALVSACAASEPWPAHYLSTGVDRLTQDEIIAQLGPADETHSLPEGAWNGTITTVEDARWSTLTGRWAAQPRLNAKNTFSHLIKPGSCASGSNIWSRRVSRTPSITQLSNRPGGAEDVWHG